MISTFILLQHTRQPGQYCRWEGIRLRPYVKDLLRLFLECVTK